MRKIIWNKEKCYTEALKYSTRKEFSVKSPRAYEFLRKNDLLDDACINMSKPYSSKFKWTKEKCQSLAFKYNTRKEFQKENKNAYYSAMYNGWLDDICKHMIYKKLPNGYWHIYENCRKEALKYKTKTEFIKNSQHVYNISLKRGWLNEICKHMQPIGDRYNKCIYSYEFSDNHVYVGLTRNIDVRQKSRDKDFNDAVTKHIRETNLIPIRKQLTEYIPVENAIVLEGEYLSKYVNDGWIALNRAKTGGIGSQSNRKYKTIKN